MSDSEELLSPRGGKIVRVVPTKVRTISSCDTPGAHGLRYDEGAVLVLREKDGCGWALAEDREGTTGWIEMSSIVPFEEGDGDGTTSPRVMEDSLHSPHQRAGRQNTLSHFLSTRPMQESLVDKKILPSQQTALAIQRAQKRVQKNQQKKGDVHEQLLARMKTFQVAITDRQCVSQGLKEIDMDKAFHTLWNISVGRVRTSLFSSSIEDAFSGASLLDHIKRDETFRKEFKMNEIMSFYQKEEGCYKAIAQFLLDKNVVFNPNGERKFRAKAAYVMTAKQLEYGVQNVDKFWGGNESDAYTTSVELLKEIVAVYRQFMPDFDLMRKSIPFRNFRFRMSKLQKVNFEKTNISKERKKIFHINLHNIMVLLCHAKFSPPVSMIDRKYLSENCEVMVNDLLFSLEALETRAVKEGKGKDPLLYFCLSDCTSASPPIYVFKEDDFLEMQKHAARYFLSRQVKLDAHEYEITLPKLCQRVLKEMKIDKKELVEIIKPLLKADYRKSISEMQAVGNIQVTFKTTEIKHNYVFEDLEDIEKH